MALDDYLAKHYGDVPKKERKSKSKADKRHAQAANKYGMSIIDDNEDDWGASTSDTHSRSKSKEEELKPAAAPRFKPTESSWRTVRPAKSGPLDDILGHANAPGEDAFDIDEDERPAIAEGAELVAEYALQRQKEDDERRERRRERQKAKLEAAAAAVDSSKTSHVSEKERSPSPEPMRYGLQTASVIKEDADRAQERYLRKLRETGDDKSGRGAETIYRDAKTGKKLDIDQVRKEETESRQDQERRRQMQKEWNKGLVQQREKLEELQLIEQIRAAGGNLDNSRERDSEQRAKEHWNDPALKFLENKKTSKTEYPQYAGYAPPNRFGIRPGYRWDGVDRSNGFEKDSFKRQASASARKTEEYSHSVADW
ncbi:Pre-mRNA-splicing factor cwc26 [Coemansia aciculifera]|uniref:Pre-mRNA-splicing factor cwc26 n=1 Tax=Coemansia aciculifera TaxID=417176 RepID=A0A9W8IND7_9FUNG|nr:Pre-mRNA-splicing factor cwc26 [Coemansia aciculifera]KAJ2874152.1 Pre-mRNA-splicing factor cwc26 [Coemansia aciculifera]KAJ2884917.1 Pre-mRNA-splicing factor cwc26 [Coemansia aciculifera]